MCYNSSTDAQKLEYIFNLDLFEFHELDILQFKWQIMRLLFCSVRSTPYSIGEKTPTIKLSCVSKHWLTVGGKNSLLTVIHEIVDVLIDMYCLPQ